MSKMEFLDPYEAEKFNKQKSWGFFSTPFIYTDVEKQQIIVNIFSDLLEIRENMKKEAQFFPLNSEGPVHFVGAA